MNKIRNAQHVYHHNADEGAKVNMKVERNSKGYNWEVTVTGAKSPDEAIAIIEEAEAKLKVKFGVQEVAAS